MKRAMSLLLILCLCLGSVSPAVYADSAQEGWDTQDEWTIVDEAISDSGDIVDGDGYPEAEDYLNGAEFWENEGYSESKEYPEDEQSSEDEQSPDDEQFPEDEDYLEADELFEDEVFLDTEELTDEILAYEAAIPEEEAFSEGPEAPESLEDLEEEPATEADNFYMMGIPLGERELSDGETLTYSDYAALNRMLYNASVLGQINLETFGSARLYDFNKDGVNDLRIETSSPYTVTTLGGATEGLLTLNNDIDNDGKKDSYRFTANDDLLDKLWEAGNEYYTAVLFPEAVWTLTIDPNGGTWADGSTAIREIRIPKGKFFRDTPAFQEMAANANFLGLTKMAGGTKYGCTGFTENSSAASPDYDFQLKYGYTGIGGYLPQKSLTIYAVYEPVITLTFDAGGGQFADGSAVKYFEYTSGQSLPVNRDYDSFCYGKENYGMVREGYILKSLRNGYGDITTSLSSYSLLSDPKYHTITAQWSKEIHLTINANGGTFTPKDLSDRFYNGMIDEINPITGIARGSVMAGTLMYPFDDIIYRDGYTIKGISKDPEGTVVVEPDSYDRYTIPEEDVTWYVQWKIPEEITIIRTGVEGRNTDYWDPSCSVWPGEKLKLYVRAGGNNLTYQWRKTDPGSSSFSDIPGATASTYETPEISVDESSTQYYCEVRDDKGNKKDSRKVTVKCNYGIRTNCSSCTCAAGETAIFQVEAYGKSLTYEWTAKNSSDIPVTITDIPGATGVNTSTLRIPVSDDTLDMYTFTCTVTYEGGSKTSYGRLYVVDETISEVEVGLSAKPVHGMKVSDLTFSVPNDKGYALSPGEAFDTLRKAPGEPEEQIPAEADPASITVQTIDHGWYLYYFVVLAADGKGFHPEKTKIKVNGPQPDKVLTRRIGSWLQCALYYYVFDDISSSVISMPAESFTYTGAAITPEPVLTQDGFVLKKNVDYTLAYSSNVNVGTGTVTITGKGLTPGSVSRTFAITQAPISEAAVTAGKMVYSGKAKAPSFTVTKAGRTLTAGTDYIISGYEKNINAGTATAVLSGTGNYKGTRNVSYTISPMQLTEKNITIPDQLYTGKAQKPAPVVGSDELTLKEGTDYTVKYQNNKKAGIAAAVVTGKGNYAGTVKIKFVIAKAYNTITAKNLSISTKLKKNQKVKLGASTIGGKLTYMSSNKQIQVKKTGKIVIPKGFVGKTVITITSPATANCEECVKKITVTVNPVSVKLSKVKNSGKGKVLVKWKKAGGSGVTGYEIAIADNEEFDNARSVKVKGISKVSKAVSKMIAGKTYYVRVRTFQKEKRKTYYSEWSKAKQVAVKK